MPRRILLLLTLLILVLGPAAPCAVLAGDIDSTDSSVTIPPDATPAQVRSILAEMSDEQVRRILLQELQQSAQPAQADGETGLAGVVDRLKKGASLVRNRFEYLFSGASTAPRELPRALSSLLAGSGTLPPGRLLMAVVILSVLWRGAIFLYKGRTRNIRKSISALPARATWLTRMGRLFMRALLDLFGVLFFTVVVFICYLTLFNEGAATKPVVMAWLGAMIFLELIKVVVRFLLAPHAPELRYLPLTDRASQYIFRWTLHLARVIALGILVTVLLRLEGASEALMLLVTTFFGFLVAFMLVLITLWNKKPVAAAIRRETEPGSLPYQFAEFWHLAAITYVLVFWMCWVVGLMVFGARAMLPGLMTLLFVPMALLLDWLTQKLVRFAADLAGVDPETGSGEPDDGDQSHDANPEDGTGTDHEFEDVGPLGKYSGRFQRILSQGFRVLILLGVFFGLLRVWGVDLHLGRAVVAAGFETFITLVLAYILWVFLSRLIERKLHEKQGEGGDHGEGDGGGPGGDRFATLLQLLRKFIFAAIAVVTVLIILSSVGVDVGPLIAGASVFGIAIGFGAQTLVKDVISGIFFLTDDAFRVGDYIETGGAMGTVEEITVRSLKLRHHLGFLYTIPFGSMKMVQNNTRDWAVMKLKYRVPFDTDIQKVKKIIKKINKEIRAVPELDEMMLGDIKSQGVKAMEEYGMLMRVKFMTKPGGQFTLRKLVLAKMRKYFAEEGIEFAKPRVSVHIPDGADLTDDERAQVAAAAQKTVDRKAAKQGGEG